MAQYIEIATFHKQPYAIVDFGKKEENRFGVLDKNTNEILITDAMYHECFKYVTELKMGIDIKTIQQHQQENKKQKKRGRPKKL